VGFCNGGNGAEEKPYSASKDYGKIVFLAACGDVEMAEVDEMPQIAILLIRRGALTKGFSSQV